MLPDNIFLPEHRTKMESVSASLAHSLRKGFDRALLLTSEESLDVSELGHSWTYFMGESNPAYKPHFAAIKRKKFSWDINRVRCYFADVEFICFALLKLGPLRGWAAYRFRDHSQSTRVDILASEKVISESCAAALRETYRVRNALFHTSIDLKNVRYRDTQLRGVIDVFEQQCVLVADEVCARFHQFQIDQFDFG